MVGQTISHFKIVEPLGEGETGVVYKAHNVTLDCFVALKVLLPCFTTNKTAVDQFVLNANKASSLEHPNICKIYEIDTLPDGQMFISMVYYDGESLRKRLGKETLEVSTIAEIATQIAAGLACAHEHGIVHKNIKPENVMLTADGQVKILDFGLAELVSQSQETKTGSLIESVAYKSPEQARGEDVDQRTDVWSLGVMMYEMFSGELPFNGEHEAAVMYSIMNEDPSLLEEYRQDLPAHLQELVNYMLEKNKENRLPSLKDVTAGLKGTLRLPSRHSYTRRQSKSRSIKSSSPDRSIGPFRLRERVGIGGMGEVWAADQEEPFHRKVALKILKAGMDTDEVVARFEAERQALALMNHPYIAKVYDAGSTPQGRPYFAMEFVQGVPITEYCNRHKLKTRERLKLFIQLCEGVQHAHQKAVIHRDLKPSNVIITDVDDKPLPKIIDFGVAKATTQPLTDKTMHTHLGQLIGTPEYMSPEQAELTGEDIDTRTDVYSLGVILYELLVGVLPFDSNELREAGFEGIRRKIREEEPDKPSKRITTLAATSASSTAKNLQIEPTALSSQLRGDLDWIIMKALDKERSRRYASALDLAADIERHLNDEPVLAGPPSSAYRLKKFIKRHKVGVMAASLVVFAMLLGITGTTIGMIKAINARKAAREEAEAASRVSLFLEELFAVSDPGEARGNTITAREILDKGAKRIAGELEGQPVVQARLMATMGRVYRRLGLYDQSRSLLEETLATQRSEFGEESLEVAKGQEELGRLLGLKGDYEAARPLFESALTIREKLLGKDDPDVGQAVSNLGNLYRQMGKFEEAKPLYERALSIREKALGPNHLDVSNSMNGLAIVLEALNDYESALSLYKRSLSIREKTLGEDHPEVATSLNNLATLYWFMGNYVIARSYNDRALAIQEKVLGPDHPDLANTLNTSANLYQEAGDYAKAQEVHERALAIREKNLRADHPRIRESYYNLACISALRGDHDGALKFLRESVQRGFDKPLIFDDSDLTLLHGDSEFEAILSKMKTRLGRIQ